MIIREATKEDIPEIQALIQELANTEKHTGTVASQEYISTAFFVPTSPITIYVMELETKVIGMAHIIVFPSTFSGKSQAFLQDFVIFEEYRNHGYGKKFIQFLTQLALEKGYGKITWNFFEWNEPAARFYAKLGTITPKIANCTINESQMLELIKQ